MEPKTPVLTEGNLTEWKLLGNNTEKTVDEIELANVSNIGEEEQKIQARLKLGV